MGNSSIRKNDGAVAVDECAVVNVIANAFGESDAFALAAEASEVSGGVEVVNAFDFLFDDGPCIEVVGDVVAGGADEFYATVIGLAVGVGADERGQEGMMDVDDFS